MRIALPCLALVFAIACGSDEKPTPPDTKPAPPSAPADQTAATIDPAPAITSCGDKSRTDVLADGLELLTLIPSKPAAAASPDRCLRVLRADPAKYKLELGAQARTGAAYPAPEWAKKRGAVAVTNASMFHDGGASTGMLVDGEALVSKVNKKFGAFLAANPKGKGTPEITIWGKGCPGTTLDKLRKGYKTIVQNYRLFACDGSPIQWKDEKIYSAAAVGVDRSGRVLFIHSRAPYKMATFTELLADKKMGLDLAAAMYVEGGPEATLFAEAGGKRALVVGSYETDFLENHDNRDAWPLPNVLMLVQR